MADVSYGGFAPRRSQATATTRSLSSCAGRSAPRRPRASPVDIPGASPPRRPAARRCLLSASVPESSDAALSRSLLAQCRADADGACGPSPRPSLKECGSWASRSCSEAGLGAGLGGGGSSLTPWSTWKASSGSSKGGGGAGGVVAGAEARGAGQSSCCGLQATLAEFAKRREPREQVGSRVSALSAALRGLGGGSSSSSSSSSSSALSSAAAGGQQREHRDNNRGRPTAAEIQDSMVGLSLGGGEPPVHGGGEAGQPVSIPQTTRRRGPEAVELSPATSLASTTSTGTSTTTGSVSSSAASVGLTSREGQARALLDRLMAYFFAALAGGHPQDGAGAASGVCTTPSSGSSVPSRPSEHPGGGAGGAAGGDRAGGKRGGKRRASRASEDGGDSGDSGSDGDEDKRPRPKRRRDGEAAQAKRLACPFFKRNPRRYQEERSCVGPGWKTVHRLKEHIYRCHTLPVHCLRCHEVFSSEDRLREHSLSETPCQRKRPAAQPAEPTLEGIGLSQERRLRSRKRSDKTEQERWVEVYKICFPDDLVLPTPYYELPTPAGSPEASRTSELARYEEFVRSELPRRVRSELERRIERELIPVEERLKRQLVEIVRDLQLKLLDEFRAPPRGGACPPQTPDEPDGGWAVVVAVPPACLAQGHDSLVQQQQQQKSSSGGGGGGGVHGHLVAAEALPGTTTTTASSPPSCVDQPPSSYAFPQRGFGGDDWTTSDGLLFGFAPEAEDWSGIWTAATEHTLAHRVSSPPAAAAAEVGLVGSRGIDGNSGVMFAGPGRQHLAGAYLQEYRI